MTEGTIRHAARPRAGQLLGRADELATLTALVAEAREARSGVLVVSGEAGVGKTALLDELIKRVATDLRVERAVASESELELTYAGLQLVCGHLMAGSEQLPVVQREALETAFGIRDGVAPSPLVVGLATLGLLTEAAGDGAILCVVDDAQWLDDASARALACMIRRLSTERIAVIMAMRQVDHPFEDVRQLRLEGLSDDHARALLQGALPGLLDARVRDQLLVEARGNPLALLELSGVLSPTDLAGGFALARSDSLERRIEQTLLARLAQLPPSTRQLLLLAAADPTGDPGLLWRASAKLSLQPDDLDEARQADALVVGTRVTFRHPLIRSAVYRTASPQERRTVHAALADATYEDRDPDRRAWHRACATAGTDEDVATLLERSAERARTRGGVAAAAAFLERAAELSAAPDGRTRRLIAAAEAKHTAGAPGDAIRLLDSARDQALTPAQEALVMRLRARAEYALRRDRTAPRQLLRAAQALEPHDRGLAHDTYMEATVAAVFAGRLGEPGVVAEIAAAVLAATENDASERPQDLTLRAQALLSARGQAAALDTVRRGVRAFLAEGPGALDLNWMWFAGRQAQDVWDSEALRSLAERQVELARAGGNLAVLPMALGLLMVVRTFDGRLDAAEAICDEIDAAVAVTGHPLPQYGRTFVAAYRGRVEEVERRTKQLRADAHARGEGYALTVANLAEAVAYNGVGRYRDALASAREEMPYAHELGHAMRTLFEVVEAARRTGERSVADEAVDRLDDVTAPVGESDWARAMAGLARAQLHDGEEADARYLDAIDRFDRIRVPMLKGRGQLLYGETLRRANRRVEARAQLRAAYEVLSACGMAGFAERAARELRATGETVRPRDASSSDELTDQELNVARLARDGLTNREIGARLFISAHTAEWHLRKVFVKLGIRSRNELRDALIDD